MEYTTIILAIIVIVLIYVLYVYFVKKSSVIASSASLNSGATNQPITTLNSGQSTRYAYGIWVYVNTWDTTTTKTIFMRVGNIRLYLASNKPSLYCQIVQSPPAQPNTDILITDNFPIQKWVYVVVSADNMIIDSYLDGKLVNSTKLQNQPATPGTAANNPVVLGSGWDAYIAGFNNWSGPIGPQQAWDSYMSGNGNAVSRFFSQYSVNIAVNKDNVQQSSYTMNM